MALFKERLVKCYKCGKLGDSRDFEQAEFIGRVDATVCDMLDIVPHGLQRNISVCSNYYPYPDWYDDCWHDDGHFCQECSETLPHKAEEEIDPGDLDLDDSPPLQIH